MLRTLKDASITPKFKKCTFFTNGTDYLGCEIMPAKLEEGNHTFDANKKLQVLISVTELRSFLGLFNVFLQFVPKLAIIASALQKLLCKKQATKLKPLNHKELQALKPLKEKHISLPVLALPRSHGQFNLDTDGWDIQVGCLLSYKSVMVQEKA